MSGSFSADRAATLRTAALLAVAATVIAVGQVGRDLVQPDDTREAEVAREMLRGGDYVIPRLADLPFVEKPSGFPAVVAAAYGVAGGPSVNAARVVACVFALATLCAVFLLGRRVLGAEGGALCAALLAVSGRFCRTAHEILLDGALTTALAFALLFAFTALSTPDERGARRSWIACAFAAGTSFLVKGFVGPALFAAGLLTYLAISRRWSAMRAALRPAPILAFAVPVLAWTIPFVARATPDLRREFFVENHFGRALHGYLSNSRPPWFYASDLWRDLAPASLFLPFAALAAWRNRGQEESSAAVFFVAFAVGPLLLLSASTAKDSVYLLPAAPAMALLAGWGCERALSDAGRLVEVAVAALAGASAIAAGAMIEETARRGGGVAAPAVAGAGLACVVVVSVLALRRGDPRTVAVCAVASLGLGWALWFTGPFASHEIRERSLRPQANALVAAAGGREILLYGHELRDGPRGAMAFYADRTAPEVDDPAELVTRLSVEPRPVAFVRGRDPTRAPEELAEVAAARGVALRPVAHVPFASDECFTLFEAVDVPGSR